MKILFTGSGKSGSWQVRGLQLGAACGAQVIPNATIDDCLAADVIVAVKRLRPALLSAIQQSGRPWVWDIVDFYPQPACEAWSDKQAIRWVRDQIGDRRVIWPNQRMCDDCGAGFVLPHHYRPAGIALIREQVRVVGYDGGDYLGKWREVIEQECARRGWEFRVNGQITDYDIVVAFRDTPGYVSRHWKSNIKLANAHGSGTPFIGQRECGYLENATGFEQWVDTPEELASAFDALEPAAIRREVQAAFLANRYSVDDAARDLKDYLWTLTTT